MPLPLRPSRMMTSPIETRPDLQSDAHIRWPAGFLPGSASVFVHNEVEIAAAPETIWRILIRAEDWPAWYPNSADIHFLSHAGPNLRDRSRIRWNTFGTRITSKVLEFEPCSRLAWNAHGIGVDAYHAWLLMPLSDGTTRIITEETQNGWLARLGKALFPKRMETKHQQWLEALKARAESL